jgi:hypothetical protein
MEDYAWLGINASIGNVLISGMWVSYRPAWGVNVSILLVR